MGGGDRFWMEQALALAALGDRRTAPNPRVGCVLVRDDEVVGSGYHARSGEAHAEATALERAGDAARGATAYVNLEPCAHTGMTPPCAGLLIDSGIRRVVAALSDPNPRVDGRGFARLREAGVEVDVGLCHRAAEQLNAPFLIWQRERRPLVSLKVATTVDGLIAARDGASRWITGEPARRFVHRLRREHDAVLVGGATARRDDPRLTVRLAGAGPGPLRVVLSASLDLAEDLHVCRDGAAETRIYTSDRVASRAVGQATVVPVPHGKSGLDLRAVLDDLAGLGVRSVLVEGGGRTHAGFLDAGLVDRAYLFVADKLLGAQGATPLLDRPTVATPEDGIALAEASRIPVGRDWLVIARPVAPRAAGG